jgi:CheY-like chemotaxis protein
MKNVKIIVVDYEVDLEPLIRQKFRKQIKDGFYDFVFAHHGLEALTKLIEQPEIGLILSDINMPEMDGLTLLTRLKELKNPLLKTVIVSAMRHGKYPYSYEQGALTFTAHQFRRSERHNKMLRDHHDEAERRSMTN